jgi:hypothetical protein
MSYGLFIGAFRRTIARQHEQKATPAVESLPYITVNGGDITVNGGAVLKRNF